MTAAVITIAQPHGNMEISEVDGSISIKQGDLVHLLSAAKAREFANALLEKALDILE